MSCTENHQLSDDIATRLSRRARLGVVLPLASEEATVDELLAGIGRQLMPQDLVFCVLDHASRDSTRSRVEAANARDPRIQCLWAPENRCVVDAYLCGYHAAIGAGCDWILEMDGGGSHDPCEIPRFLTAMAAGADYAAGCRFSRGGSHTGSWKRRAISRGGTVLANLVLGTRMKDMCSGFECFRRDALMFVLSRGLRSRRHFFQTEIRFLLREWNWVEVPINYRNPGHSVGQAAITEALQNLVWLRSRRKESAHGPERSSAVCGADHDSAADSQCRRAA